MCSRTVSGTAYISRHGSTLCSPTVEKLLCRSPILQRSHVGNLRQTLKGKERFTRGWKPQVSTLLCPRRVGALPAEVQRKTSRPLGANTPAAVRVPRSAGAEKTACAVRIPPDPPMPRKRKRHRSRGASPFCGYVGRSAAAVAAITAAAAGIITTGTAGTTAAAALTAAYPDQDDKDDDPPPGIFAPEAVRRTHTVISSYQRFHYILW